MNGSPGDFSRCEKFAKIHGIPAHMRDGFCANLHKLATGEWPGRNAHKGMHALIASAALDYMIAAAAPDTSKMIRWEGPLAQIEAPTGDKRRFPRDTLTYQSFPMPLRFQRVGLQGHQGAVTVGVIEHAAEKDYKGQRVVYGHGYFLDPDVVPEVNEAVHLAEHGVAGPSVDLDSYTAVVKKNALSGETTADMVRGRQRAATLVAVPAFANLRIKITRPDTAIVASSATFAVNTTGWHGAPIAPREALFDADDAAKRIEGWANGDPKKMASMFLWIADSANAPLIGRKGYRLPWGDIVDGKPYLIFHAVYAAAALLEGAHGGLPAVPDEEKAKLRTVISSIYEDLAAEYNDASIIAPWDRQAQQQQASGEAAWTDSDGDEYDCYAFSYTAALEQFVRHHRYVESKHPRNPSKGDPAGEWIDTPHGPHGQIKVGNKWVYPPKRGEKGYKNPESSAKGIAKRGGGKDKSGPSTHVAKKASPDKGSTRHKAAPKPQAHKAAPAPKRPHGDDHEANLRSMDRLEQKAYLRDLSDDEVDNLVKKVGGVSFDDDTRDEKETEIIRQVNKEDSSAKISAERDKDKDKDKARQLREITHKGGGKTTVAKKTPQTKAESGGVSLSDRLTLRLARDAGDDGMWLKHADSKDKRESATRLQERGLLESHRKGNRTYLKITDKGHDALKGHESEEPDRKTPEVKGPEVRKKTTVVRKSTGEVKEHKLTDSQERGLKSVHEGGKAHPGSRKVLEREGYLDSEGNLTDKGRKHLGVQAKAPETKAAETVVGKKGHTLTKSQRQGLEDTRDLGPSGAKIHPATKKVLVREGLMDEHGSLTNKGRRAIGAPERQESQKQAAEAEVSTAGRSTDDHVKALAGFKTRDEARSYLESVRGKDLTDLEKAHGVGHDGSVKDRRDRLAERTVGSRLNSETVRKSVRKPETKAPEKPETGTKRSTKPRITNGWGGVHKEGSAYAHPDGLIPSAARRLGPDGDLDIDGDRLDNTLDRIATDTVLGNITGDGQVSKLRDLAARLPQGRARSTVEGLADEIDAPKRDVPESAKDAPEPLKQLMDELLKIPLARGGSKADRSSSSPSYVDALDEVLKNWNAGTISPRRLPREIESKVYNRRHESYEGKVPADRAVSEAVRKLQADPPQLKMRTESKTVVAKKTPAELDKEKIDTALAKYRALEGEEGVDEALAGLQRRHLAQIASDEGLDVSKSETTESLRHWLTRNKFYQAETKRTERERAERFIKGNQNVARRETDYKARKHGEDQFAPSSGSRPWWEQITEDTGPEGVRAIDVPLNPGTSNDYIIGSGTLYRRDGVSYLIEDGDDMLAPSLVAEQFEKFHQSLPSDLRHHQQGYVWVRGHNPADAYWAKHYNTSGFVSLATAGDGAVRVWGRGSVTRGPEAIAEELRHEFGHSVSYGEGRRFHGPAIHDSAAWLRAARDDAEARPAWMERVKPATFREGGPMALFKLTPGGADKGFRSGVTDYGQNSSSEDFAESMSLYTHEGPIGFVERNGERVPVYFRDLFPRRAAMLDERLPAIAKRQHALVRKRGPL